MSEEFFRPLTPNFRNDINESISKQITELNTCEDNVFVISQKLGLQALQTIIDALPDGYPIPMKRD